MVKTLVIYDGKEFDTKIWMEEGNILKTFTYSYGWHEVFSKNRPDNRSTLKKQLEHVYTIAPDDFLSMFKMLKSGEGYLIAKKILKERTEKLKKEMETIETVLNTN